MVRPYMILSHHRSGSNFLNELVQQHPNFECINEPFSMHTKIFREIDLIPWKASEFDDQIFHPCLKDYPQTIEFLYTLRDFLSDPYCNLEVRGIKETALFEKLEWLKQFIPNLRVVFIVRDPRCVVASIIKRNMHILFKYREKIFNFIQSYCPQNNLDFREPVQLCTWSWKIRFSLAETDLNLFENIILRLEDIILYPNQYLPILMNFLGTEVDDKQWNFFYSSHYQTRGKAFSTFREIDEVLELWKKQLTHDEQQYIESNLREEMVRLKYLQRY